MSCCASPNPGSCCPPKDLSGCCPAVPAVVVNLGAPEITKGTPGAPECGQRKRREKRWAQCNFLKPCIDGRIYRNGEYLCISYSGHIPGEQYIVGRNLPTATTYAKRRLCQFTPYQFVDPDGCCSNCVFHG